MKARNIQQEILLFTGTEFTASQYSENDNSEASKNLTEREKLQEACWNGLLPEKLPELFNATKSEARLFLWQMREANHFLALEMGEYPEIPEVNYSLDPYFFLPQQIEN
ncbi:MAG: hypothetical protein ABJB11_17020 [Ferruginibacter sp.]